MDFGDEMAMMALDQSKQYMRQFADWTAKSSVGALEQLGRNATAFICARVKKHRFTASVAAEAAEELAAGNVVRMDDGRSLLTIDISDNDDDGTPGQADYDAAVKRVRERFKADGLDGAASLREEGGATLMEVTFWTRDEEKVRSALEDLSASEERSADAKASLIGKSAKEAAREASAGGVLAASQWEAETAGPSLKSLSGAQGKEAAARELEGLASDIRAAFDEGKTHGKAHIGEAAPEKARIELPGNLSVDDAKAWLADRTSFSDARDGRVTVERVGSTALATMGRPEAEKLAKSLEEEAAGMRAETASMFGADAEKLQAAAPEETEQVKGALNELLRNIATKEEVDGLAKACVADAADAAKSDVERALRAEGAGRVISPEENERLVALASKRISRPKAASTPKGWLGRTIDRVKGGCPSAKLPKAERKGLAKAVRESASRLTGKLKGKE